MNEQEISKDLKSKGKFNFLLSGVLHFGAAGAVAATIPLWLPYTIGGIEIGMITALCAGAAVSLGFGIEKLGSAIKDYSLAKNIQKLSKEKFVKKYEKSKNKIVQQIVEKYKSELTTENNETINEEPKPENQEPKNEPTIENVQTHTPVAPSKPKIQPKRPAPKTKTPQDNELA